MSTHVKHDKDFIFVKGAKEHNLKNIDVSIPKNKLNNNPIHIFPLPTKTCPITPFIEINKVATHNIIKRK